LLVLLAGLCKILTVALFASVRVLVLAVVSVPLVLEGGSLGPRAVFTILSLGWPLVVNVYRHIMLAAVELIESQVAASRIQVKPVFRSGQCPLNLCAACSTLAFSTPVCC
jgi:hypothetical protein